MHLVDSRRLVLAAPLLAVAALLVYVLAIRDSAVDTPRAQLIDTPPGVIDDVGVMKGELARDFIGQSPDSETLRLSALRGRAVAINFWATWCTSCLAELPEFKRLQTEVGENRLAVVAVNAGESSGDAQAFLNELDVPAFRVIMDPTLVVSDAYNVYGLPTTVFLDADGVVRGVYTGQLREQELRVFVDAALAASDAPEPEPQLELITTVAREHTLEVRDTEDGRVDLRSKSLRCDDSYCARSAIDALARDPSVTAIESFLNEDPPRLVVQFDRNAINSDDVAELVGVALKALGDPLYERPLEIIRR